MSKSRYRPEHMRMLNDKRWMETKRVVWQRAQGLCEWCKRDGYITAGKDCHHIIPFESAKTTAEMERLCYDPNNCVLLCIPCHQRVHKEMMSKTKEKIKERRAQAFERWKERQTKMNNNGTERNQETMCVPSPSDGQGGAARPDDTPTD